MRNKTRRITACDPLKLSCSFTGNPFIQWNNGNIGSELIVYSSGKYFAFAIDSSGCYDTSETIYVDLQQFQFYAYSSNFSNIFCSGSSLTIETTAPRKGSWNNGDTAKKIQVSKGGRYYYVITSDSGCRDTSNQIELNEVKVDKPKLKVFGKQILCPQDSTFIECDSKNNLSWYPGGFGKRIRVFTTGYYYAVASDASSGCTAISDSVYITLHQPHPESLCMVTNDSVSGRNILMWNKTAGKRTDFYEIYRESNTFGKFDKLGSIKFSATARFVDSTSNPKQRAYTYYIRAIDSCGNGSEESIYYQHTTAHLTASKGVSGENNLNWSFYNGVYPIYSYIIYRSNANNPFVEIDRVAANKNSYTDLNPPAGSNRYYISILGDISCNGPSRTLQFRSNQVEFGTQSTKALNDLLNTLTVFPNPTENFITIQSQVSCPITITDAYGRKLLQLSISKGSSKIDLSNLPPGTYFVSSSQLYGAIKLTKV